MQSIIIVDNIVIIILENFLIEILPSIKLRCHAKRPGAHSRIIPAGENRIYYNKNDSFTISKYVHLHQSDASTWLK